MSPLLVLAGGLAGAAVGTRAVREPVRLRDRLGRAEVDGGPMTAGPAEPRGARWACVLAGVAALLVLGPLVGVGVAALLVAAGPRLLSRLDTKAGRSAREQLLAHVPAALELLAACFEAGAPPATAAALLAGSLPRELASRFRAVAAGLAVGMPPHQAWRALAPEGGPDGLVQTARALGQAGETGAAVAGRLDRLAAEARAAAAGERRRRARQVGVALAAPLGLCFLPAFLLVAVLPMVVGLLRSLTLP